jgi:3'(2'), 5'-bisphosphate nucleotidase
MVEGLGDIYPRFKPTCIWDTAAGHALLIATGGEIYDTNMQPLRYNKADIINPSFIATVKKEYVAW